MTTLRYPEKLDSKADCINFSHFQYQLNEDLRSGAVNFAPREGTQIRLYMPNTTPGSFQDQVLDDPTFPGRLGQLKKSILATGGQGGSAMRETLEKMGVSSNITRYMGQGKAADGFLGNVGFKGEYGGEALGQFLLEKAAGTFGSDAATAIALGQGQVYNPNAEIIYKQPVHRKFPFAFDFMPKSRSEALIVDQIIKEFKKWSAPALDETGNFLRIPHLWQITYLEGGGNEFRRMTKFKPCMMQSFAVQDNPDQKFHMTVRDDENGHLPVHTAINMTFVETQPILRDDHEQHARGM